MSAIVCVTNTVEKNGAGAGTNMVLERVKFTATREIEPGCQQRGYGSHTRNVELVSKDYHTLSRAHAL